MARVLLLVGLIAAGLFVGIALLLTLALARVASDNERWDEEQDRRGALA